MAYKYWMGVCSLDDLDALGQVVIATFTFALNSSQYKFSITTPKCLRNNHNLWGPSMQTCISLVDPSPLIDHKLAVASVAYQFTQFDDR